MSDNKEQTDAHLELDSADDAPPEGKGCFAVHYGECE